MTDAVDRTLKLWRSTALVWGVSDCLLSVADYLIERTGVDYGAPWRGTYSDRAGALQHVERSGGVAAMLDTTGLPRVAVPVRGDVLALALPGGEVVGALCTGAGVAARLEQGVVEVNTRLARIVAAWRVPS